MNDFFTVLTELFRQYNMFFLAMLMLVQGLGIPTGTGALVIAAGAFAFADELNVYVLLGQIWLFAVSGDSFGYWGWRKFGAYFLKKYPRLRHSMDTKFQRSENYIKKYGGLAVLFTRFPLSALGAFVTAFAGITRFKYFGFLRASIAGQLLWSSFYLGLGYWFGDAWQVINELLTQFGLLLTLLLFTSVFVYLSYRLYEKSRVLR